jgi:transposase
MCSVVAVPGVYCRTASRPGRPSITTYFRIWRIDGVWEQLNTALRERLRVRLGRNPQPSAGMIDSQSAKTTGRAAKREATTESTLRRNIEGFRTNGVESLSSTEKARRKQLPLTIRRLIVDLKGEYMPSTPTR